MQATCSLQLRVLGRGLVLAAPRTVLRGRNGHGLRPRAQEGSEGESPDWEAELAIFKQRTLKPSVAELQRKIVAEKVDVGRVLYARDNVAIIEGLNNDADVGTCLAFSSGAAGVMLWRRSDNIVFALVLGGADLVSLGDGVECQVKGTLQVLDDTEGPTTKREYQEMMVPAGEALVGQVVDFLGRPYPLQPPQESSSSSSSSSDLDGNSSSASQQQQQQQRAPIGVDQLLPLLNRQPDMNSREQINQPLMTGVKAFDILTPLGRGQAQQIVGPQGSGKSQLCIDAVIGQRGAGVRCVYAAVGSTHEQLQRTVGLLRQHGCMEYTTVVAATRDRPLGEQYAAMLTACSIAERTRDEGGHSLVVLNDVSVMVRMWEVITFAMAGLGPAAQAATDEDLEELQAAAAEAAGNGPAAQPPPTQPPAAAPAPATGAAATSSNGGGNSGSSSEGEQGRTAAEGAESPEELVEYEGMLVSAAAAQRRRFISSLIQRAAKMHRRLRGGSMTMLLVTPGVPARGEVRRAREKIEGYRHLRPEQKAKLLAALDAKAAADGGGGGARQLGPQELRTEVVEELMSITDGQVVLQAARDAVTGGVSVDPQLSVSRIGSRAYHPALEVMAPLVRLDLAQAADAARFAASADDPAAQKALLRAALVAAALAQPHRTVVPLEAQVVQLLALQRGFLDGTRPGDAAAALDDLTAAVRAAAPAAMQDVADSKQLSAATEAALLDALQACSKQLSAA
ncbi:hypothetical protein D9Q98_008700 [Chlorella vulgaris]|uniref:ATP synthase subunit alpha n=1 Tax=Chlorella vulgaris TaxID=3077 RepID=A0A9D4TIK9_CHLVU|nr:hypothetical protein D9Q98_008700 [Chlorella vulgaris]